MLTFVRGKKNVIRPDSKKTSRVYLFFIMLLMSMLFVNPAGLLADPSPPQNVRVVDGGSLTWDPNPDPDLAGYMVYWDIDSGHPYANMIDVGSDTTYPLTGLPESVIYSAVTAYDVDGNISDYSSEVIIDKRGAPLKYAFTCYYNDGAGDYYSGFFYSHESYEVGARVLDFVDENEEPGYYDVTEILALNGETAEPDLVFVDTYYDAESGNSYAIDDSTPVGTGSLGSEDAYIILADIPEYRFGGGFFEADLVSYAYEFTLTYENGDHYAGTVYAAPEYGYNPCYQKNFMDENGQTATYDITSENGGFAASLAGQVFVDTYYDQESNNTYTPVHAGRVVGTNYLGSERDYILFDGMVLNRFGVGPAGSEEILYEADVTSYQNWANRLYEPARTIYLNYLNYWYHVYSRYYTYYRFDY